MSSIVQVSTPLTRLQREARENALALLYPQLDRSIRVSEGYPEFDTKSGELHPTHSRVKALWENVTKLENELAAGEYSNHFSLTIV
jgi:hypothetical protein